MTLEQLATPERVSKTTKEWSDLAKSPVALEFIDDTIYAYGSEIACLRLAYAFKDSQEEIKVAKRADSDDIWFFRKN